MLKKLILILVFVMTLSFPLVSFASNIPSDEDYKIVIDYQSPIVTRYYDWDWVGYMTKYTPIGNRVEFGANFIKGVRIEILMDLYSYIQKYLPIIENATNAWLSVSWDLDVDSGFTVSDSVSTCNMYYYVNGTQYYGLTSSYNGSFDGVLYYSPFNFGSDFSDDKPIESFSTLLGFYANTGEGASYYNTSVLVRSYSATIFLQGVDGTDADQFIVITNDIKNVDASVQQVKDEVKVMQGQLDNIQDSINQGVENVTQKQDTIIDKISSGFANIGNQVKKAVTDAVTELFVPSEEDMVAQYDKWDSLMADRFGAVYESSQIIDNFVDSIRVTDTQETINFPVVSVDLVGTTFEFGGWEVDVVPDGFQWLVDILKMVSNIGCTVLFINGMRSRYESVVK